MEEKQLRCLGVELVDGNLGRHNQPVENTGDDAVDSFVWAYRTLWGSRTLTQKRIQEPERSQEEQNVLDLMAEQVNKSFNREKAKQAVDFDEWQEYLRKLACSIYGIDPSELGRATAKQQHMDDLRAQRTAEKQQFWDGLNRHRKQQTKPKDGIEDLEWDEAEQIYKQKS